MEALLGAGGVTLLGALIVGIRQLILAHMRRRRAREAALAETERKRIEEQEETARARLTSEAETERKRIDAEVSGQQQAIPAITEAWKGRCDELEKRLIKTERECKEDREKCAERERRSEEREKRCEGRLEAVTDALDVLLSDRGRRQSDPEAEELRARLRATSAQELPAARRTTILVVDDEPSMRRTLQRLIEVQDHQCIAAHDALEALRVLTGPTHIDLVITDVRMPGLDGVDLLHRIRTHRPDVPVVLISGDPDAVREVAERERVEVIAKSGDRGVLSAELARVIGNALT